MKTIVYLHLLSLIKSDLWACVESDFVSLEKLSTGVKMFSCDVLSILKLLNVKLKLLLDRVRIQGRVLLCFAQIYSKLPLQRISSIPVSKSRPHFIPVVNQQPMKNFRSGKTLTEYYLVVVWVPVDVRRERQQCKYNCESLKRYLNFSCISL